MMLLTYLIDTCICLLNLPLGNWTENGKWIKTTKTSVSLGSGSYSTEEINKIIIQTQKQIDLLVYYIDYIRN